jgi:hypothetical protein
MDVKRAYERGLAHALKVMRGNLDFPGPLQVLLRANAKVMAQLQALEDKKKVTPR